MCPFQDLKKEKEKFLSFWRLAYIGLPEILGHQYGADFNRTWRNKSTGFINKYFWKKVRVS